jgi:pectate lyase
MRTITTIVSLVALLAATTNLPASAGQPPDLGREVLPANDGWAALATAALPNGTIGGSAADANHVYVVHDRNELVAALAYPSTTPKIVYIDGAIDGNVDADNQPLACTDYYRPDPTTGTPYDFAAFLATYDPAVWGTANPSGPLERARVASAAAQQARVRIRIPANTTIVGLGKRAIVRGAWFDIRPGSTSGNAPMNVIIRNIAFEDSYDCFPQWAPTDGATGNWNSLYDSISVRNATHVWIDHDSFADRLTADDTLPTYFGRIYQVHDGLVDITNESDLVTVSWNHFHEHDKVMLIGSSDGATADRNKLRVTLHHNLFENLGQRMPRVRFGKVHVYNNAYKANAPERFVYFWGVGIESQIYGENNHFRAEDPVTPDQFLSRLNGTALYEAGSLLDGVSDNSTVDVVGAYNAANDPDLLDVASWTPTLFLLVEDTSSVPVSVQTGAGPFH